MRVSKILLCGSGELGSRYLQGLKACNYPLEIFVYDPSETALSFAKDRWNEVSFYNQKHFISFHSSLEEIKKNLDLVIVSTTSNARLQVVEQVSKLMVRYWVLEKVLAQSVDDIESLAKFITNDSNAWVNTPRREMKWHQSIKDNLDEKSEMHFSVEGGNWGLACNSIHFLDLFSWWSRNSIEDINTEGLKDKWFESKRQGFWEVHGTLEVLLSGGSSASLTSLSSEDKVNIRISNGLEWHIFEEDGLAKRSDGFILEGSVEYQSTLTTSIVESILRNGTCNLPTLKESSIIHKVYIESMFKHWKENENSQSINLPIT